MINLPISNEIKVNTGVFSRFQKQVFSRLFITIKFHTLAAMFLEEISNIAIQ